MGILLTFSERKRSEVGKCIIYEDVQSLPRKWSLPGRGRAGPVELEDSPVLLLRLLLSLDWAGARCSAGLSFCTRSLYWPHLALQSMKQRKFAHTPKTPKFIPYEVINFINRGHTECVWSGGEEQIQC